MALKTLRQIKDLNGKRVLLRADLNVPADGRNVAKDHRIQQVLPTIKYLMRKKAMVIILSHLGRPDGIDENLRLTPVAKALSKALGKKVKKADDCIGPEVQKLADKLKPGEVLLLENVRFYPEEERCNPAFAKKLAALGDIFVNDAFGTAHRAHASTAGIAEFLPSYAGFLLEEEIKQLTPLLKRQNHPITLIVGGAKVETKIGLLKNFMGLADNILIGGALANTFLKAQGFDVGDSLYESDKIGVAREILGLAEQKPTVIMLPEDAIVADEITEYATALDLPLEDIEGHMKILDIGSKTQKKYTTVIEKSKTVIWNGPMGLYEFTPFTSGTKAIARALKASKAKTYLGGGDTLDALARMRMPAKHFTHISTGGGAMLEFLEGIELPAIKILSAT